MSALDLPASPTVAAWVPNARGHASDVSPPPADNGFVTIGALLEHRFRLGLPHFQRGQVWGEDSYSRLLESLMWDTPCGSIILWVPPAPAADHGVFADWGTTTLEYLVVDGQQRLTALSLMLDPAEDSASAGGWSMNLAAVPQFRAAADVAPTTRLRKRPLFIPTPAPPRDGASDQRLRAYAATERDLVGVSAVISKGLASWPYRETPTGATQQLWNRMANGIQAIRSRQLQVVVKRGTPIEEIVALYNRINSSGVAVRLEERAFAAMVSYEPGSSAWLRDCFTTAHPTSRNGDGKPADRNRLLRRERERQFGFPLFLRAYAQTAAHHLDLDTIDLDLLNTLGDNQDWNASDDGRVMVLSQSIDCISATASALRFQICCDDYRFLPSAEPLWPVFALLLKYPDLNAQLIARAIVLLQVDAILHGRERVRDDVRRIRRSNTLGEAMAALPPLPSEPEMHRSLTSSRTLLNPWVSVLYWYERSRCATDYGCKYQALNVEAKAHREHIVPFSLLHPAFDDLDATGHNRAHEANAIGNLTLISEAFNFEHGADPVDLDSVCPEHLSAHHLDDRDLRAEYRAGCRALRAREFEAGLRHYRRFVTRRMELLAHGIHGWLTEITAPEPVNPDLPPVPQAIRKSEADRIRARRWPADYQDLVLQLTRDVTANGAGIWILRRTGSGRLRQQVAYQLRLSSKDQLLAIGREVPDAETVIQAIRTLQEPDYNERTQVGFTLDPHSEAAVAALRVVKRYWY